MYSKTCIKELVDKEDKTEIQDIKFIFMNLAVQIAGLDQSSVINLFWMYMYFIFIIKVHVSGIPCLNEEAQNVAEKLRLSYVEVISENREQETMVNSEELNGMNRKDAFDAVLEKAKVII